MNDQPIRASEITFGFLGHNPEPIVPQALNSWERAVIDRILEQDFPGSADWKAQVSGLTVVGECPDCPIVEFKGSRDAVPIRSADGSPIYGAAPFVIEGRDVDDMGYMIVLHVRDGFLVELEPFRGDSGRFVALPHPWSGEIIDVDQQLRDSGELSD